MCFRINFSTLSLPVPSQTKQATGISDIPDEVLTHILSYLGKDCGKARLVSKQFDACTPDICELDLSDRRSLTAQDLKSVVKAFPKLHSLKLPAHATGEYLICLEKCDNIKSLDISGTAIKNDDLHYLNPNIEELLCHQNSNISDEGVEIITSKCLNLSKLELAGKFQDKSLISISQNCQNLKHFCFRPNTYIDPRIKDLATGCPFLQSLGIPFLNNDNLILIADNFPQLRELHYLPDDDEEGLQYLVKKHPLLEYLDFTDISIFPPGYHKIKMKSFQVSTYNGLSDSTLEMIATNCQNFKTIIVPYGPNLTDAGIIKLVQGCSHLEKIAVNFSQITPIGLQAIGKHCPGLKSFECDGCTKIEDGICLLVERCHKLENLSMHNINATNKALEAIGAYCPHLKTLDCSVNQVSDSGIIQLSLGCKELESIIFFTGIHRDHSWSLYFGNTVTYSTFDDSLAVSDASLIALGKNCHQLKRIHLFSNAFSDKGLINLIQRTPSLECLEISGEGITDLSSFKLNQYCPHLRTIQIAHCSKISDVGARHILRGCKKLRNLVLKDSGVSNLGLKAIREYFENPLSPNPWLDKSTAGCTLL